MLVPPFPFSHRMNMMQAIYVEQEYLGQTG